MPGVLSREGCEQLPPWTTQAVMAEVEVWASVLCSRVFCPATVASSNAANSMNRPSRIVPAQNHTVWPATVARVRASIVISRWNLMSSPPLPPVSQTPLAKLSPENRQQAMAAETTSLPGPVRTKRSGRPGWPGPGPASLPAGGTSYHFLLCRQFPRPLSPNSRRKIRDHPEVGKRPAAPKTGPLVARLMTGLDGSAALDDLALHLFEVRRLFAA